VELSREEIVPWDIVPGSTVLVWRPTLREKYAFETESFWISVVDLDGSYASDQLRMWITMDTFREQELPTERWLNAYHVTRQFGGPEEGGWWYNDREPLESCKIETDDQIDPLMATLITKHAHLHDERPLGSVLSGGKVEILTENHPGRHTPERVPHYE
jgi:hypothetical protein